MEKYLIVLDLDETLLRNDKTISKYSRSILAKCQSLGCKIVVNTARSYIRTTKFAKQINADFVCDKKDKVIYYNPISSQVTECVIEELSKYTEHIINEVLYDSFCINKEDVDFIDSKFASIEFIKKLQSCKLILKCKNEEFSSIKSVVEKYDLSITFLREKDTGRILPKKSDKWIGIQHIKEFLNNEYKIIAFGDDITDLKTLINTDIGVDLPEHIPIVELELRKIIRD